METACAFWIGAMRRPQTGRVYHSYLRAQARSCASFFFASPLPENDRRHALTYFSILSNIPPVFLGGPVEW
jgi:hypothetical protein